MTASATREQIKGLFFHLVKAVGGVEAAGAYLGISHQRVSRLQLLKDREGLSVEDMPTVLQIATLEAVVGQPIVTGALARAAQGHGVFTDPVKEAGDVVVAASHAFQLVRDGVDRRTAVAAVLQTERELAELKDSLGGDSAA